MHRHAYKSKKLSRTSGPRRAVLRGLLDSLILYEKIETTEVKAKELAPYFEKQVSYAKKQNLASYRKILSNTINPVAAAKLNYDLVKGFQSRSGGYTRIVKTGNRLGDGAAMAIIELVLDNQYLKQQDEVKNIKPTTKTKSKPKDTAVKTKISGVKTKKAVKKS